MPATQPLALLSCLDAAVSAGLDDKLVLAVEPFPLLIGIRLHLVLDRVLQRTELVVRVAHALPRSLDLVIPLAQGGLAA